MDIKKEYLAAASIFLLNDNRKDRWAVPYNYEAVNIRTTVLLDDNITHIKGKKILDLACHFGTFSYIALNSNSLFGYTRRLKLKSLSALSYI